jgi:PAS domain-containing protein
MKPISSSPGFARLLLDTLPTPLLVMDDDMRIYDANVAAARMIGSDPGGLVAKRGGEVMRCVQALNPDGCGRGEHCEDCTIRNAVRAARTGPMHHRLKTAVERVGRRGIETVHYRVTALPFEHHGQPLCLVLLEDVTDLVIRQSPLPMCSKCKKVRGDNRVWHRQEHFLAEKFNLVLTPVICPECQ